MKTKTAIVLSLVIVLSGGPILGADHWLLLEAGAFKVGVEKDLSLAVYDGAIDPTWKSLTKPTIEVAVTDSAGKTTPTIAAFDEASAGHVAFDNGTHKGYRLNFRGFPKTDAEIVVVLALAQSGELLLEVEQVRGGHPVRRITDLHTWGVKPQPETWTVLPWGSGYLISSESPTAVEKSAFIGGSYTLPVFALIRGGKTLYEIVETWWDARVVVRHSPGDLSSIGLNWAPSLGTLRYKRRVLYRFADDLDHAGIAKAYRKYLIDRKQFSTLRDRLEKTPPLKRYLAGIEYRSVHWGAAAEEQSLKNIRHFQEAGLPVSFFYPKWPVRGPGSSHSAAWQSFLKPEPVPGGWAAMGKYADEVRELGCTIKVMINPHLLHKDLPGYEPKMDSGVRFPKTNDRYAVDVVKKALDYIEQKGFKIDALYFDGHAAHRAHDEHKTVSRKETFDAQNASFRETRRRGMIPGAELARFWCIGESDYFFFTDWSADRFRDGEPIPLFPLIFHDCYAAHFSGGGYYNEGKYDWYEDRHPRLYELMYAAAPSHNWLPGGSRDLEESEWSTDNMQRRLAWLRKWHAYYQKICYSEMTAHRFLSADHTMQQVEFANGVVADFDLTKGVYRVRGVEGLTPDWQKPEKIEH